jgi:hypothetical protein
MKDTRFIELVNLYVDRQISPDEQAELELEIQSNPRRRQVYLQYCRMHRATKLVYESFRVNAEDGAATPARRPATIANLESRLRRRRARWLYASGGLAAAACLALVFARLSFPSGGESAEQFTAARTTPAAPAVAVAAPAPTSAETAREESRAGLANLRQSIFAEADYAAMVATLRAEQERLLNAPAPARLSLFEDGVFDERATLGRGQLPLNPRRPQRPNTEFTAFQFQR